MYHYICEPNPSGRGAFTVFLEVPAHKDDILIYDGKRYRVLQVQHITHNARSRHTATSLSRLILGNE